MGWIKVGGGPRDLPGGAGGGATGVGGLPWRLGAKDGGHCWGGGTRWPPWLGEAGLPALECKDGAVGGGTSGPWERVLGWDFLC